MATRQVDSVREAWDRIAPGFDHFVTPSGDWALPEQALRLAGLGPEMRFLDVASGSGALSIPAARLGARVTSVDLSPAMIERLHARARDEGLADRVEGHVMDGQSLDLPDDTFDVAASQFGVMLFPDLPAGLGEMARVTRPGGTVAMIAFGPPAGVGFLVLFIGAIKRVVPGFQGLPDDPPPLPFQVANSDLLRARMHEAGLRDVHIEPAVERLVFRSGEQVWNWVTNSNPIAAGMVADLDADRRARVCALLDEEVRRRAGSDGTAIVDSWVQIALGTA